jgi:hypothetical protein
LLVQGKDSNAALPLHPHPAPVYHDGKIQALSSQPRKSEPDFRSFGSRLRRSLTMTV